MPTRVAGCWYAWASSVQTPSRKRSLVSSFVEASAFLLTIGNRHYADVQALCTEAIVEKFNDITSNDVRKLKTMLQGHDRAAIQAGLAHSKANADAHGVGRALRHGNTTLEVGYAVGDIVGQDVEVVAGSQIVGDLVLILVDRKLAAFALEFDLADIDIDPADFQCKVGALLVAGRIA